MTRKAVVSIVEVRDDIAAAVREALERADWQAAVPAGADVALKVNLGWDRFIPGSITSPAVVEALIHVLAGRAAAIYVVEADQVLEDVEKAFRTSGMADVCARTGARWVNFSRAEVIVECPENVIRRTALPRLLQEAVLVTVPVMKTHGKTVISGALKNQWGCLRRRGTSTTSCSPKPSPTSTSWPVRPSLSWTARSAWRGTGPSPAGRASPTASSARGPGRPRHRAGPA